MTDYPFVECAKRLGKVLIGKRLPSVAIMEREVNQLAEVVVAIGITPTEQAGHALRTLYRTFQSDVIPQPILAVLDQLKSGDDHGGKSA